MSREADWYFDYLSPYPYLQLTRFGELPGDLEVRPRPVLFAALLNHWEHKGPAEIPRKKRQTYFYTRWLAEQRGLAFIGPPRHPFNPLPLLRLTIAAGSTLHAVRVIYARVWGEGADAEAPQTIAAIAADLGIADVQAALADPAVKDALRANTDEAISRGVFGVPTFAMAGELFWGDDATPLFAAFLNDPQMFQRPPYSLAETVTPSAERRPGRKPS
ncbi:MAG: 2-hydroxychromene-2-carboxylate isomerase [Hyphomicrobiaceae bacterium]|nr:2-hydroxychromene-2-carboxylate isomerase [Hyphomicrobiaceae bacterium]